MIINNKDISLYNATLTANEFSSSDYSVSKEWLKTAPKPVVVSKQFTYGSGTLEFLIEGASEDIVKENVSNLIADIADSVINFGGKFFYKVTLSSTTEEKIFFNSINDLYGKNVKVVLAVNELYKDYVTITLKENMTIKLQGNKATNCIIEITPSQAMVDLVISGFSKEPITINNLAKDVKIIINGEDGLITADGVNKFGDTDMWEFPYLAPGTNIIKFSKNYFTGIVKYKPRYV